MKKFDSYGFGLATGAQADTQLEELAATEREDSVGSIGREAETLEPTPAQQTRNAFEILGKSKPTTATSKARREKNEFIATEADLSDEEMGMGAQSGDEDEAGMDAELEELVDNEEVDFETRDEQDRMADDLRRYGFYPYSAYFVTNSWVTLGSSKKRMISAIKRRCKEWPMENNGRRATMR